MQCFAVRAGATVGNARGSRASPSSIILFSCYNLEKVVVKSPDSGLTDGNRAMTGRAQSSVPCRVAKLLCLLQAIAIFTPGLLSAAQIESAVNRVISGVVVNEKNELVPNATVVATYPSGNKQTISDANGRFHLNPPNEPTRLTITGKYLETTERRIGVSEPSSNLQIQVKYTIPPLQQNLVISATALNPTIDQPE
jgi:hypothetical protein